MSECHFQLETRTPFGELGNYVSGKKKTTEKYFRPSSGGRTRHKFVREPSHWRIYP